MFKKRKKPVFRHQLHGLSVSRPTSGSLVVHIVKAGFSGDMFWLALFGGAVYAFLEYNQLASAGVLPITVLAVIAIAAVRGVKAWQNDWYEYQKALTEKRWNDNFDRTQRGHVRF